MKSKILYALTGVSSVIASSYYFDKKKVYAETKITTKNYQLYPTDYVHGLLSSHSYEDAKQDHIVRFGQVKKDYQVRNKHLENWKVHEVIFDDKSGYYGVIYVNNKDGQVVLAHRGTKIEGIGMLCRKDGSIKTDIDGILKGQIVPQQAEAYSATEKAVIYAKNHHFQLSTTGHSLGAWLAEQSVYFCHNNFEHLGVKAVTFDSPGSHTTMNKFNKSSVHNKETQRKNDITNLDIVTYLSAPNIVNSCNEHVGTIYRIFPAIPTPELVNRVLGGVGNIPLLGNWTSQKIKDNQFVLDGILSISGHKLDLILDTFDSDLGKPKPGTYKKVDKWPHIKYTPQSSSWSMSDVFDTLDNPLVKKVLSAVQSEVETTTVGCVFSTLYEILNGSANMEQYWTTYELIGKEIQNIDQRNNAEHKIKSQTLSQDQFTLTYEGCYKVKEVDPYKDILSQEKFNADYYLRKIYEIQEFDSGAVGQELQEIKQHYKINDRDEIISSDITIEELRSYVGVIVRRYKKDNLDDTLFDFLERITDQNYKNSPQPTSPDSIVIPPLPQKNYKKFIGREDIFKQIEEVLREKQCIAISAVAGTGKTSTALEYAYQQQETGKIVLWIDSDSEAKISTNYNNISTKYEFDKLRDKHGIVESAQRKLSGPNFFLIFDNVEKYEDIKPYLSKLPPQVKAIITTRYNFNSPQLKQITLKEFNQKEVKEYLETSLGDRGDLDILADQVGSLPYRLDKAVGVFKEKPLLNVDKYIKAYAGNKEQTDLLFERFSTSQEESEQNAWQILQYAAWLDPDFIDIKIFGKVISLNEDSLEASIKKLQLFNLIEVVWKKGEPGLKLHRLVQQEVQEHMAQKNGARAREEINDKLLLSLNELLPFIVDNSTTETKNMAKPFLAHVDKVLEHVNKDLHKAEQANLYDKLARCYTNVEGNHSIAIKYQTNALDIWQSLGNLSNVAAALNNIGVWNARLNQNTEQLKYYEQSLKMYQEGLGDLSSLTLSNAASAYSDLGDKKKALLLYKQAYTVSLNKLGVDNPKTIALKQKIEQLKPEFVTYNSQFIQKRGETDSNLVDVKQKIQINVLNTIQDMAADGGYWSYGSLLCLWLCENGIKGYLDDSYLKSQLGTLSSTKNVELAKMLIFEAINLSVVTSGKKDLTCVKEFAKLYPELVKKIIKEHPEYLIDGIIAKEIVKNSVELKELLGKNFDGKGILSHEEESYWYQYSKEGIEELLQLRLASIDLSKKVEILTPNYVWDGSINTTTRLVSDISTKLEDTMLVVLNLFGKHWVGVAIDRNSNEINISYMDSEQNAIPILLKRQLFKQIAAVYPKCTVNLEEVELDLQKYNNCGPEVIENFVAYFGGGRFTQEDAVPEHSLLLENFLIGMDAPYYV